VEIQNRVPIKIIVSHRFKVTSVQEKEEEEEERLYVLGGEEEELYLRLRAGPTPDIARSGQAGGRKEACAKGDGLRRVLASHDQRKEGAVSE
jgi:hypothetical protein